MMEGLAKVWMRQSEMNERLDKKPRPTSRCCSSGSYAARATAARRRRPRMDHHEAMDDEAALRQYTFNVGDFSRDLAAVTVRLDAARARLVLRDLERLLAEQPECDVVLEWLGALRREYAGEAVSK